MKENQIREMLKAYEKIKTLYNDTLNQIKEYDSRLEERNDIIRDFEDYAK